jgi:hypothetical protein
LLNGNGRIEGHLQPSAFRNDIRSHPLWIRAQNWRSCAGVAGLPGMCHHPVVPPPKVEPREMEGGSVEVLVSGLPQSKEEDEIRSAVESHVGPVTLDLQRAEVAHMQTVQFLVGLADHLATQQRLLRIVYRSLPTDPDRTERILDDSGVLAHPNIVAVPTPT